ASDEIARGPWVYGRQVLDAPGVEDGALVAVNDASERFVGHALFNSSSDIRLRWLARGRKNALDRLPEFLYAKLRAADDLRRRVGELARGRSVLDLFCNTGGFALQAARQGARAVRAVDLDEKTLARAKAAGAANGLAVEWRHADAFDVLRECARANENERPE